MGYKKLRGDKMGRWGRENRKQGNQG